MMRRGARKDGILGVSGEPNRKRPRTLYVPGILRHSSIQFSAATTKTQPQKVRLVFVSVPHPSPVWVNELGEWKVERGQAPRSDLVAEARCVACTGSQPFRGTTWCFERKTSKSTSKLFRWYPGASDLCSKCTLFSSLTRMRAGFAPHHTAVLVNTFLTPVRRASSNRAASSAS